MVNMWLQLNFTFSCQLKVSGPSFSAHARCKQSRAEESEGLAS